MPHLNTEKTSTRHAEEQNRVSPNWSKWCLRCLGLTPLVCTFHPNRPRHTPPRHGKPSHWRHCSSQSSLMPRADEYIATTSGNSEQQTQQCETKFLGPRTQLRSLCLVLAFWSQPPSLAAPTILTTFPTPELALPLNTPRHHLVPPRQPRPAHPSACDVTTRRRRHVLIMAEGPRGLDPHQPRSRTAAPRRSDWPR